VGKDHGSSVKNDKQYEGLRKKPTHEGTRGIDGPRTGTIHR
jgi:hypothetical protein